MWGLIENLYLLDCIEYRHNLLLIVILKISYTASKLFYIYPIFIFID